MNNTDSSIDSGLLTAGQALVKRRQKLGLDPKDCAESLKITAGKLAALETGDKSKFTSELFVRGYLKNYAKLVNITEEEILHLYHIKEQPDHTINAEIEEARNVPKRSIWWLPYFIAVSIVAAWFFASDHLYSHDKGDAVQLSVEVQGDSEGVAESVVDSELAVRVLSIADGDSELNGRASADVVVPLSEAGSPLIVASAADNESGIVPANDVVAAQDDVSQDPLASGSVVSSNVSPSILLAGTVVNELTAIELVGESTSSVEHEVSQGPLGASVVSEAQPDESVVQVAAASGLGAGNDVDILYLSFVQECWVKVVDASGETLVSSLRLKNTQLEVKGEAPFDIVLGNVVGTSMLFNGESVALSSDSPSRTLRLTVGG